MTEVLVGNTPAQAKSLLDRSVLEETLIRTIGLSDLSFPRVRVVAYSPPSAVYVFPAAGPGVNRACAENWYSLR